jgi:hypothetical protein
MEKDLYEIIDEIYHGWGGCPRIGDGRNTASSRRWLAHRCWRGGRFGGGNGDRCFNCKCLGACLLWVSSTRLSGPWLCLWAGCGGGTGLLPATGCGGRAASILWLSCRKGRLRVGAAIRLCLRLSGLSRLWRLSRLSPVMITGWFGVLPRRWLPALTNKLKL